MSPVVRHWTEIEWPNGVPAPVRDESGRIVAEPQNAPAPRLPHYEAAPYAVFAFDWPELGGAMFNVVGGPLDRSTVTQETLTRLGIAVREGR